MIAFQSVKYWTDFLMDCRAMSVKESFKLLTNKVVFVAERVIRRILENAPRCERNWLGFPFSLYGCVKWSSRLNAWYTIKDMSSVITMEGDEIEPQDMFLKEVSPGMVIVDVGAHHGRYAISASRGVGPTGLVAAIEPHPTSVQVLNENLGLNGIKNVRVLPLACWSGRAALRSVDSSLLALHAVAAQEGQDGGVRGLPLDEIVEELAVGRVDWIKIDVEGAELAVLEGARETIERFRPNLFVEIHQTLPSIRDWIFKNHYVIRHHNEDQHTAGWGWIVATPPLKPQANLCSPAAIAESIAR